MASIHRPADYEARPWPSQRVSGSVRRTQQPQATSRSCVTECQGVSGVFSSGTQRLGCVSQSVSTCHGVDVKTVVSRRLLRITSWKNSQEFTRRLTHGQRVSVRVTECQGVSRVSRRLDFDPLPSGPTRDTVRRMVATIARSVLVSAAEAGLGRIRHGCATVRHGTRNTVPSRAFAEGSLGRHCGHGPNVRVAR